MFYRFDFPGSIFVSFVGISLDFWWYFIKVKEEAQFSITLIKCILFFSILGKISTQVSLSGEFIKPFRGLGKGIGLFAKERLQGVQFT